MDEKKDCRIYKTPADFVGKIFSLEIKKDGELIDTADLLIEDVYRPEDGLYRLSGTNKFGESRCTKLSPAEAEILCYEGLTCYWNGKTQTLYKKALINIFD